MSGNKFLVDTNIVLGYLKGTPEIVRFFESLENAELYASIITRMELLSFHGITDTEENLVRAFLDAVKVIPVTEQVEQAAIAIRRATRGKLPDAIVAASALCAEATLVTCDKFLASIQFPCLRTVMPD